MNNILARLLCVVLSAGVGIAAAQDGPIGRVQSPLVGGDPVDPKARERYTLVSLQMAGGSCSGSLLRNEWVITAAHCVDNPDPSRPGEFVTDADNSVTVTANWTTTQQRQSLRIITLRPSDVALIRVAQPFVVDGSDRFFSRSFFHDAGPPYFGGLTPVNIRAFGRGIHVLAKGATAASPKMPAQSDGRFRTATFQTDRLDPDSDLVWYSAREGRSIAGGDSGGPSIVRLNGDDTLFGVHSLCKLICVAGEMCGDPAGGAAPPPGYDPWRWVAGTPACADSPVLPQVDRINQYLGAYVSREDAEALKPKQLIGTFATTPPGYQPIWVYGVDRNANLNWYRREGGDAPWQGPKTVGTGWQFSDIIPAGGNVLYAMTTDRSLLWYRHEGFNDGSPRWTGPKKVGWSWNFKHVFAGGDGVLYAIREDGELLWYRHAGYRDGDANAWIGPISIGTGWQNFPHVFSTGKGVIYAVTADGDVALYRHLGFQDGRKAWSGPRKVASGWNDVQQVVPLAEDTMLVVKTDGRALWYRRSDTGLAVPGSPIRAAAVRDSWEGPVEMGTGWENFSKVVALLPVDAPGPR